MKNLFGFFLAFLFLPLTGCSVTHIFWVTESDLQREAYNQAVRPVELVSEINADNVDVLLATVFVYPDPGFGRGQFVSHRTRFWIVDPKNPTKKDNSPNLEDAKVVQLPRFGKQYLYAYTTLPNHHVKIMYSWQDRFGNIHSKTILVKIPPERLGDKPYVIRLVENPGRDPIRDH